MTQLSDNAQGQGVARGPRTTIGNYRRLREFAWVGGCVTAPAAWASGPSALASRGHGAVDAVEPVAPPGRASGRGGAQECTQIGENGLSTPFWGICVHCCDSRGSFERPWGRRSVHRSAKMAPRRRFGAFVYTVATRVTIRIATRAAPDGTSASAATACRRLLLASPSRLVGKTGSARVAPLPGWHLRRGVNPHEPPKSHLNVVFDYRICPSLRHGLTRPKMCCPFVERGHRSHAYQRHTPPHQ